MLPASNLKQSRNCCCFLSHCLISIYLTVSISISLSLFSFILAFLLSISMAVSFSFFLRVSLLSLMLALFCLTLSSLCLSLSSQFPHQFSLRKYRPSVRGTPAQYSCYSFHCQGLTRNSSFSQPVSFVVNSPDEERAVGETVLPQDPFTVTPGLMCFGSSLCSSCPCEG